MNCNKRTQTLHNTYIHHQRFTIVAYAFAMLYLRLMFDFTIKWFLGLKEKLIVYYNSLYCIVLNYVSIKSITPLCVLILNLW